MTERGTNGSTTTMSQGPTAKKTRTQRSLHLPRVTLTEVSDILSAMESLSGPSSRAMIFHQAGKVPTGGRADQLWGAVGYYGLREEVGDGRYQLTDRGRALLGSDTAARTEARQHAVVATGFRPIIQRFSGRPAAESTLAAVLMDEYGLAEEASKRYASVLVAVATEAGLISDGRFSPAPIESAMAQVQEFAVSAAPSRRASPAEARVDEGRHRMQNMSPAAPGASTPGRPSGIRGQEADQAPLDIRVEIRIEADKHTPQEIGEILRQARRALQDEPV
jgi:hypothetical protein